MRQKRLKNVSIELMDSLGVITKPIKLDITNELCIEIGSGKGNFITSLAKDNPKTTYVAIEKNISVCYRIVEKKKEMNLDNLIIILGDSVDLLEYFNPKSVSIIYLNFSDPWPKAKHHKRRLTYYPFLEKYLLVLKENGIVQFRTDHFDLFNDSLEYFQKYFSLINVDYDYKKTEYFTEYEEKKRTLGKIYQCQAEVRNA